MLHSYDREKLLRKIRNQDQAVESGEQSEEPGEEGGGDFPIGGDLPGGTYDATVFDIALAGKLIEPGKTPRESEERMDALYRLKAMEHTAAFLKGRPCTIKVIEELYDTFYQKLTNTNGTTKQELR